MMLATDKREFQVVTGPNTELPSCTPVDVDPDHGTSDYEESLAMMEDSDSEPLAYEPQPEATSTAVSPEPTEAPQKAQCSRRKR
ncbi:hypothetical protein COL922a_014811, partial [Colletotrichum nupharicola]